MELCQVLATWIKQEQGQCFLLEHFRSLELRQSVMVDSLLKGLLLEMSSQLEVAFFLEMRVL